MARFGRVKHSFCPFRRRQQAANKRRFCISWINRVVNKQVEKRIADLRKEFLLMHDALREDMMTNIQQLKVLMQEEASKQSLHYNKLDREPSSISGSREKEQKHKNAKEDEVETYDSNKPPEQELEEILDILLDIYSSETSHVPHDANASAQPKCEVEEFLQMPLGDVSDGQTDNVSNDDRISLQSVICELDKIEKIVSGLFGKTSSVSKYTDTNSEEVKFEQEENQVSSLDVSIGADLTPPKVDSEEQEISRNLFHAKPNLVTKELGCEVEMVQADTTKEDEVLMETQWKEWMDKQEIKENNKVKLSVDQDETEKQGGAALPTTNQQAKLNVQRGDTMTKVTTYFRDIFKNNFKSHKWERLYDED